MPKVIERSFTTILALVVTKLQDANVTHATDDTRVFASMASDEDLASFARDDKFVVVRMASFPPAPPTQAGAGTNGTEIDGTVNVACWTRLWIDNVPEDDKWLTNTLGIAPLVDLVMTALEQYYPQDATTDQDYYFIQPMRLLPPGWNFPMKRIGGWGKVDSNWSLVWHLDL